LERAQFGAVSLDGGFPLRAAIDVAGALNEAAQDFDAVSSLFDRQGGNAACFAPFGPSLL
jgi:hypothetical protein